MSECLSLSPSTTTPYCEVCGVLQTRNNGFFVCPRCGLVGDQIFAANFVIADIETNFGCQYVNPGERVELVDGVGSCIGKFNKTPTNDIHGNPLSQHKQKLYNRLKLYSFRARIKDKESMYRLLNSLSRASTLLQLSDDTRQRAAYIYRKGQILLQYKELRLTHPVLMTSSLLLAIRERREPIRLDELVKVMKSLGHRVSKKKTLKIADCLSKLPSISLIRRNFEEYLPRVISKAYRHTKTQTKLQKNNWNADNYLRQLRLSVSKLIKLLPDIGGRHPYVFAVALLYTSDQYIARTHDTTPILTQKFLAHICNCGEYTVRAHFADILKPVLNEITNSMTTPEPHSEPKQPQTNLFQFLS